MQTLPLPGSLTGAPSHLFNPMTTKPSKPLTFCLSSYPFSWKPHRRSRRSSLRYSEERLHSEDVDENLLRQFQQHSSTNTHEMYPRCLDNNGINPITKLFATDCHLMDKADDAFSLLIRQCTLLSAENDRAAYFSSLSNGLKMALLIGLLTSQGSQQAVAGTDIDSGMQTLPYFGDLGDISTGFASAFLLIFFSELGDKTFFIAALLAARNSGAVVFIGTFGALTAMSIVSVVLGRTFHYVDGILPFRLGETDFPIDDFAAVCLLVYFGVTTLIDASSGDESKINEEQKEAELAVSELLGNGAGILTAANTVISTFLLVFVAEWGDKSFFSTIALAAASSPLGVIGGALAGHAVATLLAVLGGSLLGTFFSEKIIAYIGGTLFLVFAAVTLIEIVS